MGDIPEDIVETARKTWRLGSGDCKAAIARAILAERQSCADVAEAEGKGFRDNDVVQEAYACIVVRKAILAA